MINPYDDTYFMKQALLEAQKAAEKGEIPVGAVITVNDRIIARAHNQTELLNDVTAHAEMLAITAAAEYLGNKYLQDCTIYITLEPCVMCAGALSWSKIGKVVFGASDYKKGFFSKTNGKEILHPKTKLEYGILNEECEALIKSFFEEKR